MTMIGKGWCLLLLVCSQLFCAWDIVICNVTEDMDSQDRVAAMLHQISSTAHQLEASMQAGTVNRNAILCPVNGRRWNRPCPLNKGNNRTNLFAHAVLLQTAIDESRPNRSAYEFLKHAFRPGHRFEDAAQAFEAFNQRYFGLPESERLEMMLSADKAVFKEWQNLPSEYKLKLDNSDVTVSDVNTILSRLVDFH